MTRAHLTITWLASLFLLPSTLLGQVSNPAPKDDRPAAESAKIDSVTLALYNEYIRRTGKIPTASVDAAIELVAARAHHNPVFRQALSGEIVRGCDPHKFGEMRIAKTLALTAKVLSYDGAQRWALERQQRTGEIGQAVLPPADYLTRPSSLLASVIECGRRSGSTDIDAFVLAVRQAHHAQGKQFLLAFAVGVTVPLAR